LRNGAGCPHNLTVSPEPRPSPPDTGGQPPDGGVVTDEVRNRYGVLLDRAAERGLLSPHEYELRLGDLAAATTTEQMKEIVTELPIFTAPKAARSSAGASGRRPAGAAVSPGPGHRSSPWLVLVILVVVVVAALAVLALYAHHVVGHRAGSPAPAVVVGPASGLRP
jgi:Domain of unknown function (DUF1707)